MFPAVSPPLEAGALPTTKNRRSMNTLFLCLALVQSPGPLHADLHPRESEIYLEVGDLPALWKAFDAAPTVRLLRDEKIQGLLAGLGAQLDLAPAPLLEKALTHALPPQEVERWFDGLRTFSVSVAAANPGGEAPSPLRLFAVADFLEPVHAEAVRASLFARAGQHEPLAGAPSGVERLVWPGLELWCSVADRRLVIGGGATTFGDASSRAEKKQAGLGARDDFKSANAAFAKGTGETVFWYAQTTSPLDVLARLAPQDGNIQNLVRTLEGIPEELDFLAPARTLRMQLVGERFVTEIFSPDGRASAKPLLGVQPIQEAWLEPIPAKALLSYVGTLDGAALGERVKQYVAKDALASAALASIEQKLGFGIERIIARLGPAITAYSMPVAGLGPPDMSAWVDCADPVAFQADLEQFFAALGETLPGYALRTKDYIVRPPAGEKVQVPITTVSLPADLVDLGPMLSLTPSYARVGNRLVFALSSSNVKEELKRLHGAAEPPIVAGQNALKAKGLALPEDCRSAVVMDWGNQVESALNMVKALAMMQGDALPFDVSELPSADAFRAYVGPTLHVSRRVAGGTYRRNEGSFGPETWLAIAVLAGERASQAQAFAPHQVPEAAAEVERQTAALAAEEVTTQAFSLVEIGLARYSAELQRYPERLEDLTGTSAAAPDGYLPGRAIPRDGWGQQLRYLRTDDGCRFWSIGPNGIDEGGAGDDVLSSPK